MNKFEILSLSQFGEITPQEHMNDIVITDLTS